MLNISENVILTPLVQIAEAGLRNVDTVKRFTQMVPPESPIPNRTIRTGFNSDQGLALFFNGGSNFGADLNSQNISYAQNSIITQGRTGVSS